MKIYRHLCGSVIACDPPKVSLKNGHRLQYTISAGGEDAGVFVSDGSGRPQGSLHKYQRRQVANACEWLRIHAENKAMIFVATTSPRWGDLLLRPNVAAFVHNLKNGYGMTNYVWVREFAGNGSPHFHFVADIPRFDPVKLSLYWSGLFGSNAKNSIRLGSKPNKRTGRRIYHLVSQSHAWYLGKYLAKEIDGEKDFYGPRFRISKEVAANSGPKIFEGVWASPGDPETFTTLTKRGYETITRPQTFQRSFIADDGETLNPKLYEWKRHPIFSVYFGRLRKGRNTNTAK